MQSMCSMNCRCERFIDLAFQLFDFVHSVWFSSMQSMCSMNCRYIWRSICKLKLLEYMLRSVPEFAQVALQSLNDQKGYSCSVFCLFRVDITYRGQPR
jgi:hypothetical protein